MIIQTNLKQRIRSGEITIAAIASVTATKSLIEDIKGVYKRRWPAQAIR